MRKTFIIGLLVILSSCSPLKRIHKIEEIDSTLIDRTEIQKIVSDLLREQLLIKHTIIEFYPPADLPTPEDKDSLVKDVPSEKVIPSSFQTPIKRIINTEINHTADRSIISDSTAKADVNLNIQARTEFEQKDKPPPSLSYIKWIVIGVGLLLLLVIIIKFC